MARQISFGDTLRSARERKGLDLSTAARKLRIRPDILRAIEEGDFARMPPRGYTSNMVGAYARLVGLNPAEITRLYREEAQQFETGRRPMGGRSERPRPSERSEGRTRSSRDGQRERGSRPNGRPSRSSRGAAPQPAYTTNLVQGRQAPGIAANLGSMLPLIVVGAIIVGLLVLVIFLAFGGKDAPAEDTPTVPISGMPTPQGTTGGSDAAGQQPTAPVTTPVAPTSAKFAYKVADGAEMYIEVIQDGKTVEAGDVTGPKNQEYDVTGKLKFVVSGNPDEVEITVDGEKVEPTEAKSGVYTYTVDFEEALSAWKRANGVGSGSADDGDQGASGSGDSTDGDSADGDAGSTGN
ncbi:helix-turn-helix domain-containing protein [Adlercreutzia muris]|uniref:RodZ domain-containing protein n=1 Tax=Adlercreutzia muris TaxID=1796610 RepID=UPI0021D59975|nr:helix-turn-helix domain-containing protein [Adlercreutzia muris]